MHLWVSEVVLLIWVKFGWPQLGLLMHLWSAGRVSGGCMSRGGLSCTPRGLSSSHGLIQDCSPGEAKSKRPSRPLEAWPWSWQVFIFSAFLWLKQITVATQSQGKGEHFQTTHTQRAWNQGGWRTGTFSAIGLPHPTVQTVLGKRIISC